MLILEILIAAALVKPVNDSIIKLKTQVSVSKTKINEKDTLEVKMTVPHGGDCWIINPEKRVYPICFWEPDSLKPQPFIPFEKFRDIPSIKVTPAELEAIPFVYGAKREKVFQKSGWYIIRITENAETDDGTPTFDRKVYFSKK